MASQLVIEVLKGSGEGQHVTVRIEIEGPVGDFTPQGQRIRDEMCASLTHSVVREAKSFSVELKGTA